jgi:hypothetical protein
LVSRCTGPNIYAQEKAASVGATPTPISEFSVLSPPRDRRHTDCTKRPREEFLWRLLTVVAATGVVFVCAQAHAGDVINQSTISKREVIAEITACMQKRMYADKNSSYNETMRICKNQIDKQNDHSSVRCIGCLRHPGEALNPDHNKRFLKWTSKPGYVN